MTAPPPGKRPHGALVMLLALVAILYASKNLLGRLALSGGVTAVTGLRTEVDAMDVGLLNTAVGIKGLRIYNPSGFPDRVMLNMPEIYVNYTVLPLLRGKIHLQRVRLNVREFDVVKRADGTLNLRTIKALEPGQAKQAAKKQQAKGKPDFQIDVLELKVGKVVYKDYTNKKGPVPQVREFDVNINSRYEHIADPTTFAGLLVSAALVKTTVAQLTGFDVGRLQSEVQSALKESAVALNRAFDEASKRGGKKLVNEGGQAIKQTANELNKLFR